MKVHINVAVPPSSEHAAEITNGNTVSHLNPGQSDTFEHDTAEVFEVNETAVTGESQP